MTAALVTDALVMAIWGRGPSGQLPHHSDRGSQYTSERFQRLLAEHGIVCSMSRRGDCWDNVAVGSFFSILKTERLNRRRYRARDEARADVLDYIERFYNPRRGHAKLGYVSPVAFENRATSAQGAHERVCAARVRVFEPAGRVLRPERQAPSRPRRSCSEAP